MEDLGGNDLGMLTFWRVLLKQAQAKRTSWLGKEGELAERFLGEDFGVVAFSGGIVLK